MADYLPYLRHLAVTNPRQTYGEESSSQLSALLVNVAVKPQTTIQLCRAWKALLLVCVLLHPSTHLRFVVALRLHNASLGAHELRPSTWRTYTNMLFCRITFLVRKPYFYRSIEAHSLQITSGKLR